MASESQSNPSKHLLLGRQLSHPSVINNGHSAIVHPPVTALMLRLPDHQKELHRFIWELFDEQLHTDVTIALDDGQCIKAHKLILSAFSAYFRQVLAKVSNPCQQTIIVIKDMHYEDVRSLIEFMYRGCVSVPDRRLQQLLKCAKQLKIRGLYEINEENIGESNYDKCYKNVSPSVSQLSSQMSVPTISPTISDMKNRELLCFENKKLGQRIEPIFVDTNVINQGYNKSREYVTDWLNKKSFPVPNPPKFAAPALTPMQQKIALDLTKRISVHNSVHNSEPCLPIPINTIRTSPICQPVLTSHPSLFRSYSVDERQLNVNKFPINGMNGINGKLRRGPSSLDGHLDNNNNDLEPDYRKEKKRNLNIFHAAKYRNRKKQQLELLFNEENELQKKNQMAKIEIEKLESTILSLIWQHTKKSIQTQTVFSCPVCGNIEREVPKLRNHINMLHNDTEALMKFLMLQRTPSYTNAAPININNSTNSMAVPNSTVSVPFVIQSTQSSIISKLNHSSEHN